jgi:hypothetical protein
VILLLLKLKVPASEFNMGSSILSIGGKKSMKGVNSY